MTKPLRLERNVDAMGATFTIVLYGRDSVAMESAIEAAFSEVRRIDEMLSPYRPGSEVSTVNRSAAVGPVKISAELFDLIAQCQEYSRHSDGAFDISLGALIKAWGFFRGPGRMPHSSEVAAAMTRIGYRHIHLDPEAGTLRFDCEGLEIHPGGIGKGYAVDRAVHILRQRGFNTALVAGAASSIYGLGSPPSESRGWRILPGDQKQASDPAAEIFLKDMSISTSGGREKRFLAGGKLYAHILDPRTGFPAPEISMVSVLSPSTLDSEAWTKPCLIHGRTWMPAWKPEGSSVLFS